MEPINLVLCHEQAVKQATEQANERYTQAQAEWQEYFLERYNIIYDDLTGRLDVQDD